MLGSSQEKKHFIEIKGKGRMAIKFFEFNPYREIYDLSVGDFSPKKVVQLFPEGDPTGNLLHRIFSNSKSVEEGRLYSGQKDIPSLYLIPEVSIGAEVQEGGKTITYTRYQLLQVKVYEIFKAGVGSDFYLLRFANYLKLKRPSALQAA